MRSTKHLAGLVRCGGRLYSGDGQAGEVHPALRVLARMRMYHGTLVALALKCLLRAARHATQAACSLECCRLPRHQTLISRRLKEIFFDKIFDKIYWNSSARLLLYSKYFRLRQLYSKVQSCSPGAERFHDGLIQTNKEKVK